MKTSEELEHIENELNLLEESNNRSKIKIRKELVEEFLNELTDDYFPELHQWHSIDIFCLTM